MSRKYLAKLKFYVKAGMCVPNSNLSSNLSFYGINLIEFCSFINKKSILYKGNLIKVKIYIISNNNYKIKLGSPIINDIILKLLNINKIEDFNKIIELKKLDFPRKSNLEIIKIIQGTINTINNKLY